MKLENLKYQISLFGNYEEIVPNIETIKQFVELFTDEKLIPNQFKEFNLDLKEEMSRLSLTSIDNSFTINFNSDRIDFILTNINLGVFSMLDFSTFINNIKNYVLKIDSVSKKKHKTSSRLSIRLVWLKNSCKIKSMY